VQTNADADAAAARAQLHEALDKAWAEFKAGDHAGGRATLAYAEQLAVEPKLAAAPLGPGQGGEVAGNTAAARRLGNLALVAAAEPWGNTAVVRRLSRLATAGATAGAGTAGAADGEAERLSWPEAEREFDPRDPDWTKLVEGRDVCVDLAFLGRTEAETIVAVMPGAFVRRERRAP